MTVVVDFLVDINNQLPSIPLLFLGRAFLLLAWLHSQSLVDYFIHGGIHFVKNNVEYAHLSHLLSVLRQDKRLLLLGKWKGTEDFIQDGKEFLRGCDCGLKQSGNVLFYEFSDCFFKERCFYKCEFTEPVSDVFRLRVEYKNSFE